MRITLLLTIFYVIFGLFLWVTLSGALFLVSALFFLVSLVITIGYGDTAVLFLLGARELRSSDEQTFFESSSQEAYKLSVPVPKLYFYNGALERAFVLQSRQSVSLVLSKNLIETCNQEELGAICFELLLQVKKGMAPKRTKVMFFTGFLAWTSHSIMSLLLLLIPVKEIHLAANWVLNYFLNPCLSLVFKLVMGEKYFRKLIHYLQDFNQEKEMLRRVAMKLRKADQVYSVPSRKLIELTSINKSRSFQIILSLELLPHEWDIIFNSEVPLRAKEA